MVSGWRKHEMCMKDHRSLDLALVLESDPTHSSAIEMRGALGTIQAWMSEHQTEGKTILALRLYR